MSPRDERMVQFRLAPTHMPRGRECEKQAQGEICLMRVSAMMCLFPEHRQIRTIEHGWTVTVCEEDWPKVEKAFRSAYLGMPVHAASETPGLHQQNEHEMVIDHLKDQAWEYENE
jgi:hypothetical protein